MLASSSKVTVTLPEERDGTNVVVAVTVCPSASVTALPVERSMRVPVSSYVLPAARFS